MAEITIGIPFYNCESVLADAVRSVFAQTFQDWELILLDDGSTDGSLRVAQSVNDKRVRVLSDGTNKGIGARRRQIVDMASAGYLASQGADDMMHPDRLATQYEYLERNQEIGLVDAWSYLIDTDGRIIGINRLGPLDLSAEDVVRGPVLFDPTTLGRTKLYRDNQFDPDLRRAEDWDVWVRAFKEYQFGRIQQPLGFYRYARSKGRLFDLKSIRSLSYARKVMLSHGPELVGWRKTLAIVAEYHARWAARTLLSLTGLQGLRPGTRSRIISDDERSAAEAALKRITEVEVPGLGSGVSATET